MSIKSIYFENYKAFKFGEIKLDRLSILLGTNSSGKSSIIKLILMLSQSLSPSHSKNLITTGDLSDLGDIEDIFHNQDVRKNIKIEFNIRKQSTSEYIKNLESSVNYMFKGIARERYSHFTSSCDSISRKKSRAIKADFYKLNFESLSFSDRAIMLKSFIRKLPINSEQVFNNAEFLGNYDSLSFNQKQIDSIVSFISEIKKINSISSFGYILSYYKGGIVVRSVYLKDDEKIALCIDLINWKTKKKQITFSSDIIDCTVLNKEKSSTKKRLCLSALKIAWIKNSSTSNDAAGLIITNRALKSGILNGGISYIVSGFFNFTITPNLSDLRSDNVKHVGPLRFQPKRFYLIESNNIQLWNTSDGEKLSSILHKNKLIKNKINNWLQRFDLEVDISQVNNIINSIKVKDKGLNLDITDVGFGVSQILPVILQPYLSNDSGIIIIEQPEVHIHPKMQSELADFFISIIKESNKRFIIETHSDAFLKRLRRRISEHQDNLKTSISHEDVTINFIEKREGRKGTASINNIYISPTGMFEWPKDFKDNDIEDSIEFMKRQG